MQPGTEILRDIHGLDAIPWWPLAPGWWLLAGLLLLVVLLAVIRYWLYYCGMVPGWRGDARRQLRDLKKALRNKEDPRDVAARLSILMRRIAIARSGRREVAGRSGSDWLGWLKQNDSTGYNWTRRGQVLLRAPYMPPDMQVSRDEVQRLIMAAMRWVDTSAPVSRKPRSRLRELLEFKGLRKSAGDTGV